MNARAADQTSCAAPAELPPPSLRAVGHGRGYYLSTYCEHGLGEGRDDPSQCRLACKVCKAPCACLCHGGRRAPYEGYSLTEEDRLRATIRSVVARMGIAPRGPRGAELISDILSGVFMELDREGGLHEG